MTLVKSFATGYGDTYYIRHNSDNFTIIDCHIPGDRDDIIEEIEKQSRDKGWPGPNVVTRGRVNL